MAEAVAAPDGASQAPAGSDAKPTDGASSTPSQDAKPAPSQAPDTSSKSEGDSRKRTLDHVMSVLGRTEAKPDEKAEGGEATPAPGKEGSGETAAPDGGKPAGAKTEERVEDFQPIENPQRAVERRFNVLLETLKERNTRIERLEPLAGALEGLQQWTREQGLREQEMQTALGLSALAKKDPKAAIPHFEAILTELRKDAGVVTALPDDLQQKVRDGHIDEEAAREIAEGRLLRDNTARREEERRRHDESAKGADETRKHLKAIEGELNTWDAAQVAKDPDFPKKRDLVITTLQAEWGRSGMPADMAAAVAQADRALKTVTEQLKRVLPQPKTVTKMPDSTRTTVTETPKTAREAGLAAYRAMHK